MKPLLSLFGALGLIVSSLTLVTSCSCSLLDLGNSKNHGSEFCYDEEWKNRTIKNSDYDQWDDVLMITESLSVLSREVFPDSKSFYQMNEKTSAELLKEYLRDPSGEKIKNQQFKCEFVFLITNYKFISAKVIEQMKQDLQNKQPGTYLFLNLPLNSRDDNLQDASQLDFQFVFLVKDSKGKIINNKNNDWFYWYDQDNFNRLPPNSEQKYFFDLFIYAEHFRVVTMKATPQQDFLNNQNFYKFKNA